MEDVFVHTIYCDDVRQEMGGKLSFMGVYNSDLLVLDFPVNLTKFCAHVTVRFPINSEAKGLSVRLSTNENSIVDLPLPDGELQRMKSELMENKDDSRYFSAVFSLQLTPFPIEKPTTIHTYAVVDGKEIKAPGIRVRLPTDVERASLQIPPAKP